MSSTAVATYVHARDPISQAGVVSCGCALKFGWLTRRRRPLWP
jgi:hypothetical protein